MAVATGGQVSFFNPLSIFGSDERPINLVFTTTTGATPLNPADFFNIEVFTATNPGVGTLDPGFDGAVFIPNAIPEGDNPLSAISPMFTETLLTGNFGMYDNGLSSQTQSGSITLGTGAQYVTSFRLQTLITGGSGSSGQFVDTVFPGSVVGGSAPMTVAGAAGSTVTGASGALLVDASAGGEQITGGSGSLTVDGNQHATQAGNTITRPTTANATLYVTAGIGDTVAGGLGAATVWGGGANFDLGGLGPPGPVPGSPVPAQSDSIVGGAGGVTVQGGTLTFETLEGFPMLAPGASNVTIVGGAGATLAVYLLGSSSISGGSGNLEVDAPGTGDTIAGGTGTMLIRDNYTLPVEDGGNLIIGGNGTAALPATLPGTTIGSTVPGFGAANTAIVGGPGDTIVAGSALTYIDGSAGTESITGGSATVAGSVGTTVIGGSGDSIFGGTGSLEADIASNLGAETVNLGASTHGAAIIRDVRTSGGTAATTVTGFNPVADAIASRTSVIASGVFTGTSSVSGGNTVLTFVDKSTMTLVGITSPAGIRFVQ